MIVLTLSHYDIWYNIFTILFAQSDATATNFFHRLSLCGIYLRATTIREWHLIPVAAREAIHM